MNKKEKIKLHRDMINSIIDKETEIAEEITQIINDYYKEDNIDFNSLYKEILDSIYISLKQTYKVTLSKAKEIYPTIENEDKNISNDEIDKYTYSDDNLTLAERIKKYINQAKKEEINKNTLIFREVRILDNETLVLHHKLLKKKLKDKVEYGMVVTGGGCNKDCCNQPEEWIPIDEINEPPYHPNCTCEIIYDDNESDDEEE